MDELYPGRVFELRSRSVKYPAPCALVIKSSDAQRWRFAVTADAHGVPGRGIYRRQSNPGFHIEGMNRADLEKRIRCRRRDLERFDADDIALIDYGRGLDFGGRINHDGHSGAMCLPAICRGDWTIFWTWETWSLPHLWGEFGRELDGALKGEWHCMRYGGPRHLGFRFGRAWLTRQQGSRLRLVERILQRVGTFERQQASVVMTPDGFRAQGQKCPVIWS